MPVHGHMLAMRMSDMRMSDMRMPAMRPGMRCCAMGRRELRRATDAGWIRESTRFSMRRKWESTTRRGGRGRGNEKGPLSWRAGLANRLT